MQKPAVRHAEQRNPAPKAMTPPHLCAPARDPILQACEAMQHLAYLLAYENDHTEGTKGATPIQ